MHASIATVAAVALVALTGCSDESDSTLPAPTISTPAQRSTATTDSLAPATSMSTHDPATTSSVLAAETTNNGGALVQIDGKPYRCVASTHALAICVRWLGGSPPLVDGVVLCGIRPDSTYECPVDPTLTAP